MKTNTTKKATSTLLATALACSLAPTTALARVGVARTSIRAGLTQQLGGMTRQAALGQQLGTVAGFGQMQHAGGLAQDLGIFGPRNGMALGAGNPHLAIVGPGTYGFTGNMTGMVRVDAITGNVALSARDAAGATVQGGSGQRQGTGTGTAAGTQARAQGNASTQPSTPNNGGQQQAGVPGTNDQRGNTGQGAMSDPRGGASFGQQGGAGNVTPGQQGTVSSATHAGTIVTGTTTNGAATLVADYNNATVITVTDDNSDIKIKEAGTYVITGASSHGNIVVKKGVTGVVIVLQDLDLTSTSGATLSVNKGAEAQIIVSGTVTLTDAEDPSDETSTDANVADAYDGAAIKVKAGAAAYLCGDGTLTVNGNAKNAIKVSGDNEDGYGSLVIDGATINITATNDGINANHDLAILSGSLTISAGDDAIHADRVLTIGDEATHTGPTINITKSYEGLEGTVVNICGGDVTVNATDDAINAANSDGTFADLGYSINMTGGTVVSKSRADGFDSNGNVNLIAGSATISSANNGGDAGIDYDGQLYVSDEFELNNMSGIAGPDGMGMGGQMGGMPGSMGGQIGNNMGSQMGQAQHGGQMGGQMGQGGMR